MISFKQYLLEQAATGNYMSIGVEAPGISLRSLPYGIPDDGYECEPGKQHVTLIYSELSSINPATLLAEVSETFSSSILAEIDHFTCFDALPKDGERDENKCTIVAKLNAPMLQEIHQYLVARGCRHSYDEYSPHLSLWYDCDRNKGRELAEKLNKYYQVPNVVLQYYKSDVIKKDWAKSQD